MNAVLGRTNIGWYTFLICLPLSWYYLDRKVLILFPYREGLTALLSAGNFLPLVVVAVAAAWEGGRQSSSTLGISASVRSPFVIAAISVLPAFVVVTMSHLAATVLVLSSNDLTPPIPELPLYIGLLALLFGVGVTSWFVGYFLTNVIAAPLMAVIVYFLAILPSLTKHQEFRALVADRSGCCGIDQQVDWRSIATPLFIALGVVFVAIAIASWLWIRGGLYPLAGIIGVAALGIGLALPGQMNDPWAATARSAAELRCETSSATGIEYCVWPEQQSQLEALRSTGDGILTAWRSRDLIPDPSLVSLGETGQAEPGQFSIDLPPDASNGEIALALAFGALPDPSRCQGPALDGFSFFTMVVWLAVAGGTPIDDPAFDQFAGMRPTSLLDEVASIRARPVDDQLAWFTSNAATLATCQK